MSTESEKQTRVKRIDVKLKSLSQAWEIIDYSNGLDFKGLKFHAVREFPTANGPADYALFVNGKLLGIIEAKKVSISAKNVLEQAKRYSRGVFSNEGNWEGYRVPFIYSSNGETIYFADVRTSDFLSRELKNFHTPDALEELFKRNNQQAYNWFIQEKINIDGIRPYQVNAIKSVEEAIIKGKRQMLVAMATGTGKTFTTVSQVYRLLKSKAARRVLFLVDRKSLAAQAVKAFASFNTPTGNKFSNDYEVYSQRFRKEDFEEDELKKNEKPFDSKTLPNAYLSSPQDSHTFVYVCTVQRMAINLFGKEAIWSDGEGFADYEDDVEKMDIPIHAFDVVIADECHRGYTSKESSTWRSVIEYFDAIKIGLTATPASHTTAFFKELVTNYKYDEAVKDGFLVDYEGIKIKSNVKMNGAFLKEGEQVGIVDIETGQLQIDQLEDEREFATTEIERKITAPESNRKIIEELAKYTKKHQEETGRFPKTLIFAVNDIAHTSHADQLVEICRDVFAQGDDFVQKITGNPNVDRPLQRIREFRNRPKPMIAVTVDMLTTGVDIPSLEFIVFLRPVKSRILWEQMLGRGTRLCKEINKTHFTIFDCFDGTLIEYFKDVTNFGIEPPIKDPAPLKQVIENIYANTDREYNVKSLVRRFQRIDKNMSGEAREKFAAFIPDGDVGRFASELPSLIRNNFTDALKLLRNENFQDLAINYPRPKKIFTIGYEIEDQVSSEYMFRVGENLFKPPDYLESFGEFVKGNPEHIEAIQILLQKPKGWKAQALTELRQKLKANQFEEKDLQKAHKSIYGKDLADIISMVKHAAKDEEPIYTAEERVNQALYKFLKDKTFTNEQTQWLEYIKEHLIQNLCLELNDFEYIPIFSDHGGLSKARKIFPKLESLIEEINYLIAA